MACVGCVMTSANRQPLFQTSAHGLHCRSSIVTAGLQLRRTTVCPRSILENFGRFGPIVVSSR